MKDDKLQNFVSPKIHEGDEQQAKSDQCILKILKNCMDHVVNIYKNVKVVPKIASIPKTPQQSSQILQKVLKKLVSVISKQMIPLSDYIKLNQKYAKVKEEHEKMVREEKDYKCELNVLEKQLEEAHEKQVRILNEREREKQFTEQFKIKMEVVRQESQKKLKKRNRESSRSMQTISERKHSLPLISSYQKNQNQGLILISESPGKSIKTSRLVEHLKKKKF